MTPREYLDLFRERWRAVAAGLVLGILVAVAVVLLSPAQYVSQTTLFVSAGTSSDPSAALDRNQLSVERMQTYVQLATSDGIAEDVVASLELDMTSDELQDKIAASSEPDTVLLTVSVTDTDPARAADIANVLADRFASRVEELEQPANAAEPPPPADPAAPVVPADTVVAARVVEEAVPAESPVWPRPLLTVAIGALLGLLAGVALAVLRRALAPTVTDRRRLADLTRAPVLGVIARHRKAAKSPIVVRDDATGPLAEGFRRLRANLQSVDAHRAQRVVMFTSPTPRAGTTTVVCNFACAVAEAGQRVVVVEADLRTPRAADCFGAARTVGLTNVLAGEARLQEIVLHVRGGVDIVTSGPIPSNPGACLASPQMPQVLAELREQYDAILIDTAALLRVADATVLAPSVDAVVLVVRHGAAAQAVEAAQDALRVTSTRLLGTVLTMVRGRPSRRGEHYVAAAPPAAWEPPAPAASAPVDATETPGSNGAAAPRRRPSPFPRTSVPKDR